MPAPTLARQVEGVLPARLGGSNNQRGWAQGQLLAIQNRTGGSLAQYLAVTIDPGTQGLIVCSQDSQVPVLGILVGSLDNTGVLVEGACANGAIAAILTSGVVPMVFDSTVGQVGEYVYTSAANPGHVYGKATRGAGAIGMLLSSTGTFTPGTALMVAMWSGVSLAGPLHTSSEGSVVNAESDSLDFGAVLPARTYGHTTAVDIAPELLGGLVAAQIAYAYGAPGTTIVRPTSDIYSTPTLTFSSGSVGWSLVNGASAPAGPGDPHYTETGLSPAGTLVHGFANPALDFTHRIDSVVVSVYRIEALSGLNGRVTWRDPATGQVGYTGSFVPATGYIVQTYTTRPWDGRPWTIADLPYLQFGINGAGGIYQVFITVNWTKQTSVGDELAGILSEAALVWRPLLAGDGTIVTAGPGGEAIMGLGPP